MEIQDLLQWLEYTDLKLSSTKTVWGMPDTASEKLSAHLVMLQSLKCTDYACYYIHLLTVCAVNIYANVVMFVIVHD